MKRVQRRFGGFGGGSKAAIAGVEELSKKMSEEAVKEAVYVADYSIRHGIEAEVIVERNDAEEGTLRSYFA